MISTRTGRWLVHDCQQWVFAEPPREEIEAEEAEAAPEAEGPEPVEAAGAVAATPAAKPEPQAASRIPRIVLAGIAPDVGLALAGFFPHLLIDGIKRFDPGASFRGQGGQFNHKRLCRTIGR